MKTKIKPGILEMAKKDAKTRGGARPGSGRKRLYGEKVLTRTVAASVPEPLIRQLDRRAKSEGLTRSAAVTAALREWLAG